MTTAELIEHLKVLDPSGEMSVQVPTHWNDRDWVDVQEAIRAPFDPPTTVYIIPTNW